MRYFDFNSSEAPVPHEFLGTDMQHRIYFQFIVRRSATSSLSTGSLTDEGNESSDIVAESNQLLNSNTIIGSSVYYQSYYVAAS